MSGKLSKGLFDRPRKVFGAAGKINPGKMAQQAQQMAADQAAAPAYGEELNRINRVGTPGTWVITGAVDTGECTAGNPWH